MEEQLIARLLATAGVLALVGTRIKPIERPQGQALPALTVQTIIGGRAYTMGGADGTTASTVQIDAWGSSYQQAKELSREVIEAIEPPATQDDIDFIKAFVDVARDMPVEDIDGGGKVFRVSMDFIVWWKVSAGS